MRQFKTISEFHQFRNLPGPHHPLISLIHVADVKQLYPDEPTNLVFDFYVIALKRVSNLRVNYGQHSFDFNEGILSFMAPGQVIRMALIDKNAAVNQSGWVLNIHPDFLWNTPLAKTIRQYDFWSYALHEALFLSAIEEAIIDNMFNTSSRNITPTLTDSASPLLSPGLTRC